MELVLILLILIVVVGGVVALLYNRLVRLRNAYTNAFAQIDVQLKRRHDLIPRLVETVKGYMKHERETLEAVIKARNQAEEIRQQVQGVVGDPRAWRSSARPKARSAVFSGGCSRSRRRIPT